MDCTSSMYLNPDDLNETQGKDTVEIIQCGLLCSELLAGIVWDASGGLLGDGAADWYA
jgi:hypothetical protein